MSKFNMWQLIAFKCWAIEKTNHIFRTLLYFLIIWSFTINRVIYVNTIRMFNKINKWSHLWMHIIVIIIVILFTVMCFLQFSRLQWTTTVYASRRNTINVTPTVLHRPKVGFVWNWSLLVTTLFLREIKTYYIFIINKRQFKRIIL